MNKPGFHEMLVYRYLPGSSKGRWMEEKGCRKAPSLREHPLEGAGTLSPIMEVENYPNWKETYNGRYTHFPLNHDYGRKCSHEFIFAWTQVWVLVDDIHFNNVQPWSFWRQKRNKPRHHRSLPQGGELEHRLVNGYVSLGTMVRYIQVSLR